MSRRSGIPMKNSKILPYEDFSTTGEYPIPRRFIINAPSPSDLMFKIKSDSYIEQGFTLTTDNPATLNKERVWYDMQAPNFGEGPKL